ncbi:MAG: hypothetical protein AABN95_23290 [Acidobacteriota bacterium]
MKRCPSCSRTYTDPSLNFCLEDGSPLVSDAAPASDPGSAGAYPTARDRNPPPTQAYNLPPTQAAYPQQVAPLLNQLEPSAQPRQWSPMGVQPQKKSNAVWWVLGGVVVAGVIVVGAAIMILALVSMSSDSNKNTNAIANTNRNSNSRVVNRNSNANSNVSNTNSTANLPASFEDDFSEAKWGTGNYDYGDIWYDNDEYHMRAKAKSYLVMYAPTDDYNTENATVRVTTRSVDGNGPTTGYGLIIHGEKSKSGDLEDYALLIYTGAEPQYEIIKHKGGTQTTVVPWTKSKTIRSGTNPNQLEIRAQGAELTFYINGQYIDRLTDTENFKRGVAGLYTSDSSDIAFDDLEIKR